MDMDRDEIITDALVITRAFDAPREMVFKAWTEPQRMMQWFGPRNITTPVVKIDLRPGGVFELCMRTQEGQDFYSKGYYREIVAPEKLVYTDSFSDADGKIVPASYYNMTGEWPLEMLVTVTFEDCDCQTEMTMRHEGIPEGENRDMAREGWSESFDKLAEYLASESGKIEQAA